MITTAGVIESDLPSLDDAALRKELEGKSLQELMAWKRIQDEEAKKDDDILNQVRRGSLAALRPYLEEARVSAPLDAASASAVDKALSKYDLNEEQVGIAWPTSNLPITSALDAEQQRANELFGVGKVECIAVKDANGRDGIAAIGVGAAEFNAASRIARHQDLAERRAHATAAVIREMIPAIDTGRSQSCSPIIRPQSSQERSKAR